MPYKFKKKAKKKPCTICKNKIRIGQLSKHMKVCKTFFQWYKVFLTEAGYKRYICLACGMKKTSSKDKIISHLQARHFELIRNGNFKCRPTFEDETKKYVIFSVESRNSTNEIQKLTDTTDTQEQLPLNVSEFNNSDGKNKDVKTRVCPICLKMWSNWSKKDFLLHQAMCNFIKEEKEGDLKYMIQDLEGKKKKFQTIRRLGKLGKGPGGRAGGKGRE